MLPRLASLESEFTDALNDYVRHLSRSDSVIREIRGHTIHEGSASIIQRSPTDSDTTKMVEAKAETMMDFDEIESADVNYIMEKATEIAKQFRRHYSETLFETLNHVTAETGQQIDGGGAPLTNEMIMEMLSKMDISFEHSPHGDLTIVTAPEMAPRFQALDRELNENPELRRKMNELMDRKRHEFREREINRNLVG